MNELYYVKTQELMFFLLTRELDKEQKILLAQVIRTMQKHFAFMEGALDESIEKQKRATDMRTQYGFDGEEDSSPTGVE